MKDVMIPKASLGVTTWWEIPPFEIPYEKLEDAWTAQGLDEKHLLDPPREAKALRRAVGEHKTPRLLARPLKRGSSWALVDEQVVGDEGLKHHIEATARIIADGDGVKRLHADGNGFADKIRVSYERQRTIVNQNDLSNLLVKMIYVCGGIALRKKGIVYFVPQSGSVMWEAVSRVVTALGIDATVARPRPEVDEEVIATVLNGILNEAKQDIDRIDEEVQKTITTPDDEKALGTRALRSRVTEVDQLRGKVSDYERLLGKAMPEIQFALMNLSAAVTEAEARVQAMETARKAASAAA